MGNKTDRPSADFVYPHKTPFTVKYETDTWVLLLDLDDDSAASILDSADWVVASLRVYRGVLTKKIYFLDTLEGLLEIIHDGEVKTDIIRCSENQKDAIERLIKQEKAQGHGHTPDTHRRNFL